MYRPWHRVVDARLEVRHVKEVIHLLLKLLRLQHLMTSGDPRAEVLSEASRIFVTIDLAPFGLFEPM